MDFCSPSPSMSSRARNSASKPMRCRHATNWRRFTIALPTARRRRRRKRRRMRHPPRPTTCLSSPSPTTRLRRPSPTSHRRRPSHEGLGLTTLSAAPKKPATIKDLDNQQVDVSPDPPQNVDAAKTMDSYKRFLDLNAGDAALRAEALRRLGDLNLESSESERIERELATNEGLRATEAIHLYTALR